MITIEDTLQEVLNRLPSEETRCVDVETSGLDWKTNHIVGYVCTFGPGPGDTYYLPFRHAGGGNIGGLPGPQTATGWNGKTHPGEKKLLRLLNQPGTLLFGHNIGFDLKFMAQAGFAQRPNSRIEDTMINAPLLNEFQPWFSLEYCCQIAKVAAKKSREIETHICKMFPGVDPRSKGIMGHYWRLSGADPMAVEYAAGDGTSTWQLRDWQMPQIHSQDLTLVHDIESRLIPILTRMSLNGIRIDEERLAWLEQYITATLDQLSSKFPPDFNTKSPIDVQRWMQDHGCTDWPKTPKGAPSMVESWLETHEPGRQIVQVRKLRTLQSTFVEPMRNKHMYKGRVHTSYNQLKTDDYGTITGRLSSNDPNLQAVIKHNETVGRLFRSIFVPDDFKGYKGIWASVDYRQCEPVLLACYSRCKALLAGFRAEPPIDAHTVASMMMCGSRWDKMNVKAQKEYRNNYGKRINQTIITGGGQNVLVTKYKVPVDEVNEAWNAYHRAMPEIKILQKNASRVMRTRGYVLSLLKRRARLERPDLDYVAVNRLLQVGNADILKLKMVEIDDAIHQDNLSIDLLNNCHDAFDFQFPDAPEGWAAYEKCQTIMQDFGPDAVIKLDVPLRVDAGEGPNWAIATYGEEK